MQLIGKSGQQLLSAFTVQTAVQVFQPNRDDVVVVQSAEFWVLGELKPNVVQEGEVNFSEPGSVRTKPIFRGGPIAIDQLEDDSGFGLGKTLPRIPSELSLLVLRELFGESADDL